jgi:hypothetical protein
MNDTSALDVRKPIGVLFAVLGALLLIWGTLTWGAPGSRPTGIPIVPIWGGVMLAFGAVMLLLSTRNR